MKKLEYGFAVLTSVIVCISCQSVDFDKMGKDSSKDEAVYKNIEQEQKAYYDEVQQYLIQEKLKEVDIPKTVVYVEKPVYYPVGESAETDRPALKGKDAVIASTKQAQKTPEQYTGGTMFYDFDADFTYEIYCQPYRVTDLILEPGEQVIEMPFLSEEKVWEIGAGVSRNGNIDTQHFFLKPAYSGLISSFIIITDKRVYHFILKSFKDCYMTQVKFKYPNTMPFNIKSDAMNEKMNKLSKETTGVDPAFLSFDYKMTYSVFKKPYWLPTRVYDDGKHTYIVMNETVLHMTSPVLFNHKDERINYSVNKNLIVINELIEKVTMRVGREKVTIKKKYYKESQEKPVKIEDADKEIKLEDTNASLPPANHKNSFNSTYNSKLKKETYLHSQDIVVEVKNTAAEDSTEDSKNSGE
ncbi:TrbG/VirB9 family P-type conjugative transfer protein [Treponema pectinovorum]|uniref:TrbG/VirB9 family P-type conjugative transfer protein n=1 Tax=Treponema pectinovorum TaxID=164 RepID=UPI0011F17B65|nr:TrbG/VirB9 family P-type conjugative transfer protein [Treponema pectinovorum]